VLVQRSYFPLAGVILYLKLLAQCLNPVTLVLHVDDGSVPEERGLTDFLAQCCRLVLSYHLKILKLLICFVEKLERNFILLGSLIVKQLVERLLMLQ